MKTRYHTYLPAPSPERDEPGPRNPKEDTGFFKGQNPGPEAVPETLSAPPAEAPLLSDTQIRDAIRYMRNSYARQSIELLRSRFGLSEGHQADRELVLAIAQYQLTNHMDKIDGKLGPDTFNVIQSEGGEVMQDVIFFRVSSPLGGRMEMFQGGGLTSMTGHFRVEVRFPPGTDCGDYQYRQYICGNVEMLPVTAGPEDPMVSLNSLFTVPGGALPAIPNYREDGNTTLNARYGHREMPARPENRYTDENGATDQAHGCIFKSWDMPGITDRRCQTGELYDFDFRFRGEVRHKDRGVIATRYWNVTESFTIP